MICLFSSSFHTFVSNFISNVLFGLLFLIVKTEQVPRGVSSARDSIFYQRYMMTPHIHTKKVLNYVILRISSKKKKLCNIERNPWTMI